MEIKIAFLQILPGRDLTDNLLLGREACIEAKEKGADIALFPEMWSDGYYLPQEENELKKLAIKKDSDFVEEFRNLAQELQMAIGITFLETHDPSPLNSVVILDRSGKEVLHYSKVHTCAFDAEKVLSGGDDFCVADIDLGKGTRIVMEYTGKYYQPIARYLYDAGFFVCVVHAKLVKDRKLEKVAKGVYVTEDTWADRLYILQYSNPKIIFSGETALYLNMLMEREYSEIVVSVPEGHNGSRLRERGVIVHQERESVFGLGE
ncbi:MAG: carbon-nitrogen hydrolase family protein, partial [Eubacterium sp.]|nr:carbon-nitrogen hydrolase family protein [Eubacterium sp.]